MFSWHEGRNIQDRGSRRKTVWIAATLAALTLAGTGCSAGGTADTGDKAEAVQVNTDPVKLVLYQYSATINDEEVKTLITEPVKKKYPYIDIEFVHADKENTPESLVASGNVPDLVYTNDAGILKFKDLNAVQDLSELIKANRYDLDRIEPNVIESIKGLDEKGQFLALPFSINFAVLFYNKDIFDKFAVPYPKDGMTWEEAAELARKLTRTDNGQKYFGLHQANLGLKSSQLSLSSYDPNTKKATLTTDDWVRVFQTHQAIAGIPGNTPSGNIQSFMKDQNLAMMTARGPRIGDLENWHNAGNQLNWDMVALPTFKEAPKTGSEAASFLMMITSTSKHKDEAFKVLQVITDEANQTEINKRGRQTVLKDPKIKESFGESLNSLKGKNIQAVFYNTPAVKRFSDKFSVIASDQADIAIEKVTKGETDINTALRQAEDEANKLIQAELKK